MVEKPTNVLRDREKDKSIIKRKRGRYKEYKEELSEDGIKKERRNGEGGLKFQDRLISELSGREN